MRRSVDVYLVVWIAIVGVPTAESAADHIKDLQTQAPAINTAHTYAQCAFSKSHDFAAAKRRKLIATGVSPWIHDDQHTQGPTLDQTGAKP